MINYHNLILIYFQQYYTVKYNESSHFIVHLQNKKVIEFLITHHTYSHLRIEEHFFQKKSSLYRRVNEL